MVVRVVDPIKANIIAYYTSQALVLDLMAGVQQYVQYECFFMPYDSLFMETIRLTRILEMKQVRR